MLIQCAEGHQGKAVVCIAIVSHALRGQSVVDADPRDVPARLLLPLLLLILPILLLLLLLLLKHHDTFKRKVGRRR